MMKIERQIGKDGTVFEKIDGNWRIIQSVDYKGSTICWDKNANPEMVIDRDGTRWEKDNKTGNLRMTRIRCSDGAFLDIGYD